MNIYIDQRVHDSLDSFYEYAKQQYITLDKITISRKIQRIYDELYRLGDYAFCYGESRLKNEWKDKKYKECIIENFHFAFQLYKNENDELFVYIHDACHSLLYYE